ncbi:uncharacterized protein LOC143565538 [Bidens hawaiensis]|uniref:uncharacterized protein LOC143565538 n=1 Tax=Bidens hawaiensis TaxID=980011 RepID=UPI00404B4EFE
MSTMTDDHYLDSLLTFVEDHTAPLLDDTIVLKLNPVGLRYVQCRLQSLSELERMLAGAPVNYFRAYVSDLGDHRALEQLRRILRMLTSLKVVSLQPCRDPTPICLFMFGRLKVLEMRGCDLSTSPATGLVELRHTLEKIVCYNSTDAVRHVFASRIAATEDSPQWKRLSFVSCASNGLVLMDDSLRLLPVVETLDLSRNKFSKVDNLWRCSKLKHLDLGFNHLRTIASFSKVSCQIAKLVLRYNALTTIRGIENLKSLEGLDLSYNAISSFEELELLTGLPSLQNLWLEGNPVCAASWYRAQIYSFFSDPDMLILDDKGISTREAWKRQIIIASRHTQPASFGFYNPAKNDAAGEGSVNTKMKTSDGAKTKECTSSSKRPGIRCQNVLGFGQYVRQGNANNPDPNNPQPNPSTVPMPTVLVPQSPYPFEAHMVAYMRYLSSGAPNLNTVPGFQNPTTNMMASSGSQPDDETVPETQFNSEPQLFPKTRGGSSQRGRPRKHVTKPVGEPQTKKNTIPWSIEEWELCARAWCVISEDPECANFQASGISWNKIKELFHELGGDSRREKDSLLSKWTNINTKCTDFHAVHSRMTRTWSSGVSDAKIMERALIEYQHKTSGSFNYFGI